MEYKLAWGNSISGYKTLFKRTAESIFYTERKVSPEEFYKILSLKDKFSLTNFLIVEGEINELAYSYSVSEATNYINSLYGQGFTIPILETYLNKAREFTLELEKNNYLTWTLIKLRRFLRNLVNEISHIRIS